MGNGDALAGKAAIRTSFGAFFSTLEGIRHAFRTVFADGSTVILEADVTHRRRGHAPVTVPAATVIETGDAVVRSLRVYVDLSPLLRATCERRPHGA